MNEYSGLDESLDVKICTLITLCTESGNYGRLVELGLTLLENIVNEKCIPLKFKKVGKGEPVFMYMEKVNQIVNDNLDIIIFEEELIERVRNCILYLSKGGNNIQLKQVKDLFTVYYDLMKIETPNLYDVREKEDIKFDFGQNLSMYQSFMNGTQGGLNLPYKKKSQSPFVSMMINQLNVKEKELKSNFQKTRDKDYMLGLLKLKRDKDTILHYGSKKKILKENMKDDFEYRLSLNKIPGLAVLGLAITFFLFATLLTIQSTLFPQIMMVFNTFTLVFFLIATLLLYFYYVRYVKVNIN